MDFTGSRSARSASEAVTRCRAIKSGFDRRGFCAGGELDDDIVGKQPGRAIAWRAHFRPNDDLGFAA